MTTEIGFCSFCGRPRNLRHEQHQLGALVRTIVTCETCHRTLSSTIGVASTEPMEAAATEPAAAETRATPETAATVPAAKAPAAKPAVKPAAARKPKAAAAKSTARNSAARKKAR